jgi:hypothetical protein
MTESSPESHVFYVTSRGYAADHWYAWFVKSLNAHPELLAYLGNEGSRPKYFSERSRAERPNIVQYTHFLADIGMTYTGIGDCYSYRANKLDQLLNTFEDQVRIINLVRHPYVWLRFYVRWRVNNMRMASGQTSPLDHEWNISNHELFKELGLRSYTKDDTEIWATYQGMLHLNHIIEDYSANIKHIQLEDIVNNQDTFQSAVNYLTHGRVTYSIDLLDAVYAWLWTPFRGEEKLVIKPNEEFQQWPEWKTKAFVLLHSPEARDCYEQLGYRY